MIGSPIGSQTIRKLKYLRYPQLPLDWTTALCFAFSFPSSLAPWAPPLWTSEALEPEVWWGVSEISSVVSPTAEIPRIFCCNKKSVTKNPFTFGSRAWENPSSQGFKSQQPKCQTPTPRCGGRPTPWSLTHCNSSRDWIIILGSMFNCFTVQVLLSKRWLSDWILLQLFILFCFGLPKKLVATSRYYIPSCHGTSV